MAGDITAKFGTSNQALTITLASLAASATVGRASTAVDNSTNLYLDALVTAILESGTVSGNKQALLYGYASNDGGASYSEGATGTDAAFTRNDPTNLKLVGVIEMPANATVYRATFSLARAFDGTMPERWGVALFNDSGVALSSTAGNNKVIYQGVKLAYT
jgi:hypothetical protein